MGDLLIVALGLVTAAATAGGAYLVARRTSSGHIDTTEAGRLWSEAGAIRDQLRADVAALTSAHRDCEDRSSKLREELLTARGETITLRNEILTLRHELEASKGG